jgi:hypothetical protein
MCDQLRASAVGCSGDEAARSALLTGKYARACPGVKPTLAGTHSQLDVPAPEPA